MKNTKWAERYLRLAKEVSTWSKDPSTQVGAVIVGNKGQVLSQGYNGFPRGIKDTPERLEKRELKYDLIVHAEMNAIYNATYNGVCLNGASIYVYGLPICHNCAKAIIQVGIREVYIMNIDQEKQTWYDSWLKSAEMFDEAGIVIHFIYSIE